MSKDLGVVEPVVDFCYQERIKEMRNRNPFINNTDLTFRILLDDILEGRRPPGSPVNQADIADALGVSRSPVRTACKQLEADKFLISLKNRGLYVYILDPKDALGCIEFRIGLETLAASLAVNRATAQDLALLRHNLQRTKRERNMNHHNMLMLDAEFHEMLVACSKNEMLNTTYRTYRDKFAQIRFYAVSDSHHQNTYLRHGRIYNALAARKADELDGAVRDHLQNLLDDSINIARYTYNK